MIDGSSSPETWIASCSGMTSRRGSYTKYGEIGLARICFSVQPFYSLIGGDCWPSEDIGGMLRCDGSHATSSRWTLVNVDGDSSNRSAKQVLSR
jgi:hypothetical protein